mmetsp:Transcript_127235/g.407198  ORF Transcript_127235/g.407198 Transcript_127235/m.407198 type:complete len:223 (+) Transcript_127235:827-1495(+)
MQRRCACWLCGSTFRLRRRLADAVGPPPPLRRRRGPPLLLARRRRGAFRRAGGRTRGARPSIASGLRRREARSCKRHTRLEGQARATKPLEELAGLRSPVCVPGQHVGDQGREFGAAGLRQGLVVAPNHGADDFGQRAAAEGQLQREQLVEDDAERPDVGRLRVRPSFHELRGEVERCAMEGVQHECVFRHLPRDAEIAQLHLAGACEQKVQALDVAMDHAP